MAKIGRPTKYTEELLEKAREYVYSYEEHGHAFPSDIGLSVVLDIHSSTLYEWAKDDSKTEFSEILDKINKHQQLVAWNKGLNGDYNANLVKLLLGKHGYSDKAQQEISGPGGGPVETKTVFNFIPVSKDD